MRKLLTEFKSFAVKGNVIDLSIGVIIGQAFGKIVTSLVGDIVTPLLGLLTGQVRQFADLTITLRGTNTLKIGSFIQTIIDFFIVTFSIFLAVKGINRLKKALEHQKDQEAATEPAYTKTELLLEEIRDLLKKENA